MTAPVIPITAKDETLYVLADDLSALMNTLECTDEGTPDREECEAAIGRYMANLSSKVDSVCAYFAHLEYQAKLAADEIKRLQSRKKRFESRIERLESYCIRALQLLPLPKKGLQKLEGDTNTLRLSSSEGVVILDEKAVMDRYKTITIEMPLPLWKALLNCEPDLETFELKTSVGVKLSEIKAAIKKTGSVDGADLEFRTNLRRE